MLDREDKCSIKDFFIFTFLMGGGSQREHSQRFILKKCFGKKSQALKIGRCLVLQPKSYYFFSRPCLSKSYHLSGIISFWLFKVLFSAREKKEYILF